MKEIKCGLINNFKKNYNITSETENIILKIKQQEKYLRDRYFIKHLGLYGSYAKKQQNIKSDLDLLYTTVPNGPMTLSRLRSIEDYLSQLLKIEKIELVSNESLNPVVKRNIEQYVISIF
ncbi:MAG: nucleotidyltransferase domain-containing protein [Ginsengibacter sp.]